jgi:hypothetical protein
LRVLAYPSTRANLNVFSSLKVEDVPFIGKL